MKERPIIFSGPMIRASLRDIDPKTVTRRPIKKRVGGQTIIPSSDAELSSVDGNDFAWRKPITGGFEHFRCPYGVPGDELWVREAWRVGAWNEENKENGKICVDYKADGFCRQEMILVPDEEMFERLWIQSSDDARKAGTEFDSEGQYHWEVGQAPTRWRIPRFMPRWVSRIQLVVKDVGAERLTPNMRHAEALLEGFTRTGDFFKLWNTMYAKKPQFAEDANPWVWRVEFERKALPEGGQEDGS